MIMSYIQKTTPNPAKSNKVRFFLLKQNEMREKRMQASNPSRTDFPFFVRFIVFLLFLFVWSLVWAPSYTQPDAFRKPNFETYSTHHSTMMSSYLIWTYRNQRRKNFIRTGISSFAVVLWNAFQSIEQEQKKNKNATKIAESKVERAKRNETKSFWWKDTESCGCM